MNRLNFWLVAGFVLALSACSVGGRNLSPVRTYDFGVSPPLQSARSVLPGLALEVRSPSWFDSLGIDYRLNQDDPLRLREYADSRWAVNPGVLVAQRLRQSLGASSSLGGMPAPCLLRVELQEFSQVFESSSDSRGLLQGELVLIDSQRQRLAVEHFFIEKPAATPDARGGVGALILAVNELGEFTSNWLAGLSVGSGSEFCPPRGMSR